MKFHLRSLTVSLFKGDIEIPFHGFDYFWGQMGAGKTSIARLVDYCLGGDIDLTPALQQNFVSATLQLELETAILSIDRPRDSDKMIASWDTPDGSKFQISVPARDAAGEVLPGTGVEVLSDLLFHLSGESPPLVRKSKVRPDSERVRLSMRDLLWYCYLDQDYIDSVFFHLDERANPFKKPKSRDVMRYIIGFHDERVAELEATLDETRGKRLGLLASIDGLKRALTEVGVESEGHITARIGELETEIKTVDQQIEEARAQAVQHTQHAVDTLRHKARSTGEEIGEIEDAITALTGEVERELRHLHEVETLTIKFRRASKARAVLSGVAFESCPRCAQALPRHQIDACPVCGQIHTEAAPDPTEMLVIDRDARARIQELRETISQQRKGLADLMKRRDRLVAQKSTIERARNEALSQYDSAYLSSILTLERQKASLTREIKNLHELSRLPMMLVRQREEVDWLEEKERKVRRDLGLARIEAQKDASKLDRLKELMLDCLIRAKLPGIARVDRVEIDAQTFYPEVYGPDLEDVTETSFATLSSGGKKSLFKSCFAIAVHRLATEVAAPLPKLLIIDSPMKNISERQNRQQFHGFYKMLYDLKVEELQDTQIIMIDKEFCAPKKELGLEVHDRQMRPGSKMHPPLIPWHDGH
jgi:hypothetical protein